MSFFGIAASRIFPQKCKQNSGWCGSNVHSLATVELNETKMYFIVAPAKYHRSEKDPYYVRQSKHSLDCEQIPSAAASVIRLSVCSYYSHSLGDVYQRGVDCSRPESFQVSLAGELQSNSALHCCIGTNKLGK